ncbi:DUF1254 domain-containing protein [Henriciella litoralis]|uniref:DUF1254 domain-containing protein n=1 Tax=Henriciella litoralis TaxID=568102 RepID=UPI000A06875C|nr:DUF1254 domain-containing protein [Henriciella litoralis]
MRWLIGLIVFVLTAIIAHLVVLNSIPAKIMSTAMERMADRGIALNGWTAAPRITPETQTVVRPSPDLSYAICRFDTSDGPVLLSAPTAQTYGSLSIFDDRTNNVFVASLQDGSDFEGVIAYPPGNPPIEEGRGYAANGLNTVEIDGKGLALIRRLAPDQDTHDLAAALIEASRCEKLGR